MTAYVTINRVNLFRVYRLIYMCVYVKNPLINWNCTGNYRVPDSSTIRVSRLSAGKWNEIIINQFYDLCMLICSIWINDRNWSNLINRHYWATMSRIQVGILKSHLIKCPFNYVPWKYTWWYKSDESLENCTKK